jgi:hypothetical protein
MVPQKKYNQTMKVGIEQRRPVSIKVGKLFELMEEVSEDIWSEKQDLESGLYPSNIVHLPQFHAMRKCIRYSPF